MPVMWYISLPSGPKSVTFYLPGAMPSEKYSPFLLSLSVYFRPVSMLSHSTVPSVMGFPSASRHTPFTVPVAWANMGGTHTPSTRATSSVHAKRCFIGASTNQLPLQIDFKTADFKSQICSCSWSVQSTCNLQSKLPTRNSKLETRNSKLETRNSSNLPRRRNCHELYVRDWISGACFLEGTQPQHAAITNTTGSI